MTRFILSYLTMFVLALAGALVAHADNSKRPGSISPTLLKSSASVGSPDIASPPTTTLSLASGASSAVRHAAAMAAKKVARTAAAVADLAAAGRQALGAHLARVTAYWSGEGDYYTRHHIASTGVHLHQGHCAVDPRIIPYGSVVQIEGLGTYLAVDTGTAVVSRQAAKESGHNRDERGALVIDLYFENRQEGEKFAATGPKFAAITWFKPLIKGDTETNPANLVALAESARTRAL